MEGRELPVGWETIELGQVAAIWSGIGFPKEHQGSSLGEIGFYKVSDISRSIAEGKSRLGDAKNYISAELAEQLKATIIPVGSTVFAKIGEAISLNRRAIAKMPCIVDNNVMAVKTADEIQDTYAYYFLRSQDFKDLSRATTVPSLRKSDISGLHFPVPPSLEQSRIAAKLDTTLAAVDACRQRLDGVAAILKRFRQAVLAAATSGELTREWREENQIEEEWCIGVLGDLLRGKPRNGYSPKPTERETEVKSLTLSATTKGRFLAHCFKYIDEIVEPESYLWLQPGDILIQRANTLEYVGVSALYEGECGKFIYPDLMMKCQANERTIPRFLHFLLLSERSRSYFRENATGTSGNMPKINQQIVLSLPVRFPSLREQQEIIERAQRLFTLADQLEARLTTARKVVDRLTPALLAKAFRGELVPQDPNDEPASVLLERIRAARQAEAATGKPSRRGRPKAAANPASSPVDAAPVTPDRLATLLRECGALSERALLAASELDPASFRAQLAHERSLGAIGNAYDDGQVLLKAVG
jgi:type I restriction enzyme S subunit